MSLFDHRSAEREVMDNLQCDGRVVDQTLKELEIINRLLGGNRVTLAGVQSLLKEKRNNGKITIADLGCGGGDMLKLVADWGRRNKLKMQLIGIDANPNIIDFAVRNSKDYPEIRYEAINIFSPEFRARKYDVCLSTLFAHHFSDDELTDLFLWFSRQIHTGVVINDIHRHWFAFHSIRLLTRFFSKSAMVKSDAPLSVLRAFSRKELETLLIRAGIENYQLRWKWAFRWQLIIPTV